jgi:bifunctional pyridoxal-dependent enzyme with beta-cystathionase and maltose regulon repressor activities
MLDHRSPADLRALGSLKWTYFDEDVLAAWVAEMDFGLAPSITTALHDAVDRGDTAYLSLAKERATADVAVAFWADRLGWEVSPQQVFSVPDVVEGIRRAIVHLTAPGSAVAMHTPALEELAAVAASHGARIISDEIHAVLTYAGSEHVAAASVDPKTVVTVTPASKAWNLPEIARAALSDTPVSTSPPPHRSSPRSSNGSARRCKTWRKLKPGRVFPVCGRSPRDAG